MTTSIQSAHPERGRSETNPFIPISEGMRLVILVYFIGWRIMPLCADLTAQVDTATAYYLMTVLCKICIQLFLLAPMIMPRFLGSPMGWVHPLVLPGLVSIALGILQHPQSLLTPLFGWFPDQYQFVTHELLSGVAPEILRQGQFMFAAFTLLGMICLYLGFSSFRLPSRLRQIIPRENHFNTWRYFTIFALCFLVVIYFLNRQGGIVTHMTSFAAGRFAFREFGGPFLVINDFLPLMLILWYFHSPKSLRNPAFVIAFFLACAFQFIVTGSRSGMFVPIAMMLAAWMFQTRRVPAAQAFGLGMVVVLLIGVLGEVRRSGHGGELDLTALTEFDFSEARELAQAELEGRSRETPVAIFVTVPSQVEHLWGRTYVAALGFWIPRLIWRGKPRGAGAHTAAMIYAGLETAEGYSGGGIPPGAVAEAYWNFNIAGVIVVFFLYGGFVRICSDWYANHPTDPVRRILLIVLMFQFQTPTTFQIVNMLQTSTMVYVLLLFTRTRKADTGPEDMVPDGKEAKA